VLWLEIPAERMKGGKPHSIPLVGTAEEIVVARMPAEGGYLFPSRAANKPIQQKVLGVEVYASSGRSDAPAYKHRKVCPVPDWAPHDLRRTARTLLAELGCPFEVGEAILAHTLPGVSSVYNRAGHEAAKVEWLTKLGAQLDDLARGSAKLKIARTA
jgi:integrase